MGVREAFWGEASRCDESAKWATFGKGEILSEAGALGSSVCETGDAPLQPKGNRVNSPEPGYGDRPFGAQCGNANQLGDADGSPGKSFLFSVRRSSPWNGFTPR
ncbi:hypothetical protein HPB50_028979 [Hyalomma asiaticum]|nr:hypothetical protein HPB50_029361 [Hyalomma asiaticum]KAH6920029.1 hypothetical protein HPB50_028979 [Hyalomma asiaticum]